ncbi:hypothetical protein Tco_1348131 [Tanacetum coccineum]
MGTPTQVCVWSFPNFSAPVGRPFRCVKSKVCDWYWKRKDVTQGDWVEMNVADRAQSSRVPVPLPEDPFEAIRQAYLDGTDTEFDPFEDLINTEIPESPLAIAIPIPLSESTLPVLVPILCRIARMAVRVPHAMSSGLSAGMAEVEAMSEFTFSKRFRSSYESSPSVSPPDLPSRKHYRGTSELVEDSKEDDDEEDEEIEESMDSDSVSEDAEDEGPTAEDEDLAAEDEGLTVGVEGPGMDDKGYGLDDESRGIDDEGHSVESDGLGLNEEEEEEAVSRGQQQAASVVGTTVSTPLGLGYGALRHPPLVQTPPSPEWTSSLLPFSPSPYDDPSPILSSMIPLTVPSPVATPAAVKIEGFLPKLGAQVQMQGGLISDHVVRLVELSPALFERSLEYEQERVVMTFGVIWRPVLSLEAWAGQTDAQRVALWHAISNVQGENRDLRLQLTEERRVRLELAEVVDGMSRGQEPRGGA